MHRTRILLVATMLLGLFTVLQPLAGHAMSSEQERVEHRSVLGSVLIGPDPSIGGRVSVWFLESGNGDLFYVDVLDALPPDRQQFFQNAFQQGRFITVEGSFEWWGEGNILRSIDRLE